ncbi:MAG: hypothetical protein AVDCRST_MAG11-3413, partial [uncultured Gemmatimonadaceae bacterium]
ADHDHRPPERPLLHLGRRRAAGHHPRPRRQPRGVEARQGDRALPVRRVGEQAVLRRHALAHRLQGRRGGAPGVRRVDGPGAGTGAAGL